MTKKYTHPYESDLKQEDRALLLTVAETILKFSEDRDFQTAEDDDNMATAINQFKARFFPKDKP